MDLAFVGGRGACQQMPNLMVWVESWWSQLTCESSPGRAHGEGESDKGDQQGVADFH
jgi:hypothetical protein